ncbi:MAG: ABC transporter permease [Thermoanaerobaculia bacterium]
MIRGVPRRLLSGLILVWLVLSLTFLLLDLAPGDPAQRTLDPRVPRAQRDLFRRAWGLDAPVPERYGRWLAAVARGDWGVSLRLHVSVREVIGRSLPYTLTLTGAALIVQFTLGIAGGLLAARRQGWIDRLARGVSQGLYSLPLFWLGLMAILMFSLRLGWLPPGGPGEGSDRLRHLVLPALVLGIGSLGPVLRLTRNLVRDALDRDFVRAARARGAGPARILWIHALPHAAPSLCQSLGVALPALLSGSLITEVVFAWPGLGRVTWEAVLARDVPVVMATTALGAVAVVAALLLADLLQAALDPRLRHAA